MMRTRIEIVKGLTELGVADEGREFYVRVVAGNGEILLTSELYANASNARRAAKALRRRMPLAYVVELAS